ncbi:dynein assembly factor 6, axonemal [Aplysia californica]|uniref:Dynein assembly factor 6, axonemal n=1 Tax=Aplysia californica TaxID=6500 RepID=A0ABM0K867_APLCA|nr:dynein assembly factor 6, axonemal [Aplysia californica]
MSLAPTQISAIVDLFKDPEENSDSDEDVVTGGSTAALGPGSIGPEKGSEDNSATEPEKKSKDIWAEEEIAEGSEFDSVYDPRPQPDYDILYSQSVTSEDIFLQMGNKTPMTASCENMTVKIKLPATKMSDVELDVKSKFLDCRTPRYKLGLHLPHPVDPKSGNAKWDGKNDTLIVSLKMSREYDMFNF